MILTVEMVNKYIDTQVDAWSESSLKSERARLNAIVGMDISQPMELYKQIKSKYAPYTLKTIFIRLSEINPVFKLFLKEKRKLFKNSYKREVVKLSLDDVRNRINNITDLDVRKTAEVLLSSGLRANEIRHIGGGQVVGKGSKVRSYFGSQDIPKVSYMRLYRGLKSVGLKPHTLRKVFATRLAEAGFKPQDLCQVMGWSSFETAKWYLQPKDDAQLYKEITAAIK